MTLRKHGPRPGPVAAIVALALLAACGPKQVESPVDVGGTVSFPPPPDTARIQFLTKFGSSRDIEEARKSGSFLSTITGARSVQEDEQVIFKPYGVSIANNKIYVCDAMLSSVEIIDLEARTFEYFGKNEGGGVIGKPINCYADPQDGTLYVTDVSRGEVLIYDAAGEYVGAIGAGDVLYRPIDVQVRGDTIWVADQTGHRVVAFDRQTWQPLLEIPKASYETPEGLRQPTNIWVTEDEIYVSDFGNFKVQVYTHDGEYVRSVGEYGRGFGMFVRPKGIAVDRDGILYAVDAGFQNVQMFNEEGELLMFFGGPYAGPGTMYLPAKVIVDYDHLHLFEDLVDPAYEAKHLVIVTNQYGWDKVAIYARVEPKPGMGPAPVPDSDLLPGPDDGGTSVADEPARD
jgi:hypothetical protein